MFAVYVIALLCWASLGHGAPLACEDLVRPQDGLGFQHLEGRQSLVAASLDDLTYLENFKRRDSATIYFANSSDTSKLSFIRSFRSNDSCQYLTSNITVEGSSFAFEEYNITVTFLSTSCPDCALMRFDDSSKKPLRMYLFSRRRELEEKEMEEFKAQAKCLNMHPPVLMDPTKELCPEQITRGEKIKRQYA